MRSKVRRTTTRVPEFRVPKDFDLEKHFPEGDRDFAAYVLNLLHGHAVTRRDGSFKRLNRKLLVKYVPERHLTPMLRKVEKLGVIEVDHYFEKGVRSKGFRLTPAYYASRGVVCGNRQLARKIQERKDEREARILPVHERLRAHFRRLKFDRSRAEEIIATQRPQARSRHTNDEYRTLLREVCARVERAVHGNLVVDRFGRVHSVVTNLPKILRPCLSVGGKQLVGLDIKNSQPLIVGMLAQRFSESRDARYRMINRDFNDRTTPYAVQELKGMQRRTAEAREKRKEPNRRRNEEERERSRNPITSEVLSNMCCAGVSNPGKPDTSVEDRVRSRSVPPDLVEYLALCEAGQLYEHLQGPGQTRDEAKKALFKVFYGEVGGWKPLFRQLKTQFPTVARMLKSLKRHDYAHAARLMQSFEATLMIPIICGRLLRERPKVTVITIHDSILTTPEHDEYVKGVILDEFEKLGVVPPLKVERYD